MRYLGKRFFFYERYSPIMKRITENIINSKNQKNTNNKNIINKNINIQNKSDIKYYNQNFDLKSKVNWNKEW
jgi:hypothetical protein